MPPGQYWSTPDAQVPEEAVQVTEVELLAHHAVEVQVRSIAGGTPPSPKPGAISVESEAKNSSFEGPRL